MGLSGESFKASPSAEVVERTDFKRVSSDSFSVFEKMFAVLEGISRRATSRIGEFDFYDSLLSSTLDATGFDLASLSVFDSKSHVFRVIAHKNQPTAWVSEVSANDMSIPEAGLFAPLEASDGALVFCDFDSDVSQGGRLRSDSGGRGTVIILVRDGDTPVVLTLQSTHRRAEWSLEELRWYRIVAERVVGLMGDAAAAQEWQQSVMRGLEEDRERVKKTLKRCADEIDREECLPDNWLSPCVSPADRKRAVLTLREEEVLMLLSSGASNKEIAAHLSVSVSTVKKHVHSILAKTGVRNRTEAVKLQSLSGVRRYFT